MSVGAFGNCCCAPNDCDGVLVNAYVFFWGWTPIPECAIGTYTWTPEDQFSFGEPTDPGHDAAVCKREKMAGFFLNFDSGTSSLDSQLCGCIFPVGDSCGQNPGANPSEGFSEHDRSLNADISISGTRLIFNTPPPNTATTVGHSFHSVTTRLTGKFTFSNPGWDPDNPTANTPDIFDWWAQVGTPGMLGMVDTLTVTVTRHSATLSVAYHQDDGTGTGGVISCSFTQSVSLSNTYDLDGLVSDAITLLSYVGTDSLPHQFSLPGGYVGIVDWNQTWNLEYTYCVDDLIAGPTGSPGEGPDLSRGPDGLGGSLVSPPCVLRDADIHPVVRKEIISYVDPSGIPGNGFGIRGIIISRGRFRRNNCQACIYDEEQSAATVGNVCCGSNEVTENEYTGVVVHEIPVDEDFTVGPETQVFAFGRTTVYRNCYQVGFGACDDPLRDDMKWPPDCHCIAGT